MPHKIKSALADHKRVMQHVGEDTRVQQHLAEETDINFIMAKYQKTGLLTHVSRYAGEYGDFSSVPDYQTGLDRIRAADEMFESLPAKIRDRFGNNPANFIGFATDPENLQELRKMGLAPPEPEPPKPSLVQVVEAPEATKVASQKPSAKTPPGGDQ